MKTALLVAVVGVAFLVTLVPFANADDPPVLSPEQENPGWFFVFWANQEKKAGHNKPTEHLHTLLDNRTTRLRREKLQAAGDQSMQGQNGRLS